MTKFSNTDLGFSLPKSAVSEARNQVINTNTNAEEIEWKNKDNSGYPLHHQQHCTTNSSKVATTARRRRNTNRTTAATPKQRRENIGLEEQPTTTKMAALITTRRQHRIGWCTASSNRRNNNEKPRRERKQFKNLISQPIRMWSWILDHQVAEFLKLICDIEKLFKRVVIDNSKS